MSQPTGNQMLARGVLDAVMEESRRQARQLGAMKTALERGDNNQALEVARELCGLKANH